MSLINEALKKAQRQRAQEEADAASPAPSGGKAVRRNPPRTAEATLLISAGAVVLVVLSVVLTAFLLNRNVPEPPTPNAAKNAPLTPAAEPSGASPVVVARIAERTAPAPSGETASPVPAAPEAAATTPGAPTPVSPTPVSPTPAASAPVTGTAKAAEPLPAEAVAPAVTETSAPRNAPAEGSARSAATTTPAELAREAAAPAPKPPPKPDERAHAYLDTLRVTGIRASGNDSRVLMNERVYRVNDIVERNLGLRLTKVGTDSLTFEDANGATYVKYF